MSFWSNCPSSPFFAHLQLPPPLLHPLLGGLRANVTFSLIRHSAEQGNVASLLMLADSYLQGDGVEQDWVRSAAVYYDAYQVRPLASDGSGSRVPRVMGAII